MGPGNWIGSILSLADGDFKTIVGRDRKVEGGKGDFGNAVGYVSEAVFVAGMCGCGK